MISFLEIKPIQTSPRKGYLNRIFFLQNDRNIMKIIIVIFTRNNKNNDTNTHDSIND